MDTRIGIIALAAVFAVGAAVVPAHAITHTQDLKTNMKNYRTCTDPLLATCTFPDVVSPSKYFLAKGTTTTVVRQADGTVQLKMDADAIGTDSWVSYPCANELYQCTNSRCADGPAKNTACTADRCFGGANHMGACSGASACPGGTCTGGSTCIRSTCQGGLRDDKECGGTQPSCTSTRDTTGWSVVFRGNQSAAYYDATLGRLSFELLGDGEAGCMKVCLFSLGSTGAINSSGLSCTSSGACSPIEAFHHVEITDPDGTVMAVPGVGPAEVFMGLGVRDPAVVGDCDHNPSQDECQ
jgi:hypothetical protein